MGELHTGEDEGKRDVRAPPTGYLEIERALRLLASGDSDSWVAGRLRGVDHPAATEAAALLRRGAAAGTR